jgi:hypothetical protein
LSNNKAGYYKIITGISKIFINRFYLSRNIAETPGERIGYVLPPSDDNPLLKDKTNGDEGTKNWYMNAFELELGA